MILDLFLIAVTVVSVICAIEAHKQRNNNPNTGLRYRLYQKDEQLRIKQQVIESKDKQIARLQTLYEEKTDQEAERLKHNEEFRKRKNEALSDFTNYSSFANWANTEHFNRLGNALSESIQPKASIDVTAQFTSASSGEVYTTTLSSCTCPDFTLNHVSPCKHMHALAWKLGLVVRMDAPDLKEEILKYTALREEVEEKNRKLTKKKREINGIITTNSQRNPWLAKLLSEYQDEVEECRLKMMELQHPRALTAREEIAETKREKAKLKRQLSEYKHQLEYIFKSFRWMKEFVEAPPVSDFEVIENDPEYEKVNHYLTPNEYASLSESERNQLALDRYKRSPRGTWEAGIMYERYVGYMYEKRGYTVEYRGAIDGLSDMGRDIIAKSNEVTYIIQCKRWYFEKTIHEKHVFQLYGSTIMYKLSHPDETIRPLFITTASLSKTAEEVARELGVEYTENYELRDYPMIKCNIGKSGEKIYHLPFDQQYDKVVVSKEKGELYCDTVEDAEKLGFRRAFRWSGTSVS